MHFDMGSISELNKTFRVTSRMSATGVVAYNSVQGLTLLGVADSMTEREKYSLVGSISRYKSISTRRLGRCTKRDNSLVG